jgi:hypothetical protein
MNIRVSFVAVLILFAAGCSEPAKQQPSSAAAQRPTLVALSPSSTIAGQKFNTQSDGRSAIGVKVKDATSAAVGAQGQGWYNDLQSVLKMWKSITLSGSYFVRISFHATIFSAARFE